MNTGGNPRSRRRVLIGAYACDPYEGSEPAVGWNWALQAARFADTHVITRTNNRGAIEEGLKYLSSPYPVFHYLDLAQPLQRMKKLGGTFGLLAYYYLWQIKARRLAKRLHRKQAFDLFHHVTFANDWLPSGLIGLDDTPSIWGPVGGSTHRAPAEVEARWSLQAQRYARSRRFLQQAVIRSDPLLRRTLRKATLTLPYTQEASAAAHLPARRRVVTHIGITADDEVADPTPVGEPLRIATGGRLVHWKGLDLMIRAVARATRCSPVVLTITGTGPERHRLEALATELGLADEVRFVGRLPRQQDVLDLVRDSDLFALPTWRDGPPVAILEAMSVGTPPLCLDLGATAELVPDDCGIKIAPDPLATLEERVADALVSAAQNRASLAEMGRRALQHVAFHHNWDRIGDVIGEIYDELAPISDEQAGGSAPTRSI